MNATCPECKHTHQGQRLGYICIGCPCQWKPAAMTDKQNPTPCPTCGGCGWVEMGDCRCGSGMHPRPCAIHPRRYEQHIAEINSELAEMERVRNEALEEAARVCEEMVIGGRAWEHDQEVAAEVLFAAAAHIRSLQSSTTPSGQSGGTP